MVKAAVEIPFRKLRRLIMGPRSAAAITHLAALQYRGFTTTTRYKSVTGFPNHKKDQARRTSNLRHRTLICGQSDGCNGNAQHAVAKCAGSVATRAYASPPPLPPITALVFASLCPSQSANNKTE
ncbi:MAG: hypothetical protein K2Z80_31830 [Xanthobacteraceae bacterium]|nr:hypothetical protein [Xanthobacteraceae bacterium]